MLRAWTQAARFFILDLRDDGVPTDPMVPFGPTAHVITEAVTTLDLSAAPVNDRSTSSARYSPDMMLARLTSSYFTGAFSGRTRKTARPIQGSQSRPRSAPLNCAMEKETPPVPRRGIGPRKRTPRQADPSPKQPRLARAGSRRPDLAPPPLARGLTKVRRGRPTWHLIGRAAPDLRQGTFYQRLPPRDRNRGFANWVVGRGRAKNASFRVGAVRIQQPSSAGAGVSDAPHQLLELRFGLPSSRRPPMPWTLSLRREVAGEV
jgi:hypothetical protein